MTPNQFRCVAFVFGDVGVDATTYEIIVTEIAVETERRNQRGIGAVISEVRRKPRRLQEV